MRNSTIEELAYRIRQAKENNEPRPIVFLGAGASKSGGIPLANEIVADILEQYKRNPQVKLMEEEDKSYPNLMNCLTPSERNKLLKGYIDNAKINVTHIYLAQLVHLGFVDYVLTVNFDNLMLRALALYNEFPPTYDMAILKDLTTTTFKEKSVLYLHGQHHGLWLLNTDEEMNKVKEYVPPILNKIANQRMWIFIGYSGYDPIFKHVVNLGRFDNGLYWVCYKDSNPRENVCAELLDKPNTNASIIKGYDSDAFMLKLNQELKLDQPEIFDKPFSSLEKQLENIVDIDDQEHFKGVKERLEIVKSQVATAINQFEKGVIKTDETSKDELDINSLKKQIIDKIVSGKYDEAEITAIEEKVNKINNVELKKQLANLYINWGNSIRLNELPKTDESFYQLSFEKYEKAITFNPKSYIAFNSWGYSLLSLARLKKDESLYLQSIEKSKKAVRLNSKDYIAFLNWGAAIGNLAMLKNSESLYHQAIKKYKKVLDLRPSSDNAYWHLGTALSELANIKNDESIFQESFENFKKAEALNPNEKNIYNNWAIALSRKAKMKGEESLYYQAIEKYEKAITLDHNDARTFYNYGGLLSDLAKLKNDKSFYKQSIEKLIKSVELGESAYNLACAYALTNEKKNALKYLEHSLQNNQVAIEFVKQDDDWKEFVDDKDFKALLEKYSDGKEK